MNSPTPPPLLTLPLEILHLLAETLLDDQNALVNLRLACKQLNVVLTPYVFQRVYLSGPGRLFALFPKRYYRYLRQLTGLSDEVVWCLNHFDEIGQLRQFKSLDIKLWTTHQLMRVINYQPQAGNLIVEDLFEGKELDLFYNFPDTNKLWEMITRCSEIEQLSFNCRPNADIFNNEDRPSPFWPKLKKLALNDSLHFSTEISANWFLQHSPNLEVLQLRPAFQLSRVNFPSTLRIISFILDIEDDIEVSSSEFINLFVSCPNLEKISRLSIIDDIGAGVDEGISFPAVKQLEISFTAVANGNYNWCLLDKWKSLFPNLENFALDSNGIFRMEKMNKLENAWTSIKTLQLYKKFPGPEDPSIVDFAIAFPNVTYLDMGCYEDDYRAKEKTISKSPYFGRLKNIKLWESSDAQLEWLTRIFRQNCVKVSHVALVSLQSILSTKSSPFSSKVLLDFLKVVAKDVEQLHIWCFPLDFEPAWLTEILGTRFNLTFNIDTGTSNELRARWENECNKRAPGWKWD